MSIEKRPLENGTESNKKPKLITEFFAQAGKKKTIEKLKSKPSPVSKSSVTTETEKATAKTKEENGTAAKTKEVIESVQEVETNSKALLTPDEKLESSTDPSSDYAAFCEQAGFNKEKWLDSLSEDQKSLLDLEIRTLHITWLAYLHKELTKPYFLKLKRFLRIQMGNRTIFPPANMIYSWSHYTPLPDVKCLILGQDPYHNHNQAHGLAFLVLEPTRPPPSLLNIYKTLKIDFPSFKAPDYKELTKQGKPGGGDLTKWAKRGVLMLNACLTVEAHKANSHANQGWEQFTEEVIRTAISFAKKEREKGFVIMAWGSPAQKRVANFGQQLNSSDVPFLVLRTVHPSPLSAARGFFDLRVFKKCNEWLVQNLLSPIDWGLLEGNSVTQ